MDLPFKFLHYAGQGFFKTNKLGLFLQFITIFSLPTLGILNPFFSENTDINIWASAYDPAVLMCEWLSKMLTFLIYKPFFIKLHNDMKDNFWDLYSLDTKTGKRLKKITRIVMFIYKLYLMGLFLTFVSIAINPLRHIETRELPILIYQIVDFTKFPYFQIAYLLHFAQIYVILTFIVAFDGMFFVLLISASLQFVLLKQLLSTTQNMPAKEDKKFVQKFVTHHAFILEFVDTVRNIFSTVLLIQLITTVFSGCMSVYLFSVAGATNISEAFIYIAYYLTSLIQISIYCAPGQYIKDTMEDISAAMYNSDWYNTEKPHLKNAALMTITRAQKYSDIKAGGMFSINLELLLALIRLSFSFFTLMQGAAEKSI